MEDIIKILQKRDNMNLMQAITVCDEVRESIEDALSNGADCEELEDIIADELGLEPDYLIYFLEV